MTETPQIRSLDAAGESRALELGRVNLIELGGLAFDRATFEPGWRWSKHAGSGSCPERHLGYMVSGRMRFRMDDGGGGGQCRRRLSDSARPRLLGCRRGTVCGD